MIPRSCRRRSRSPSNKAAQQSAAPSLARPAGVYSVEIGCDPEAVAGVADRGVVVVPNRRRDVVVVIAERAAAQDPRLTVLAVAHAAIGRSPLIVRIPAIGDPLRDAAMYAQQSEGVRLEHIDEQGGILFLLAPAIGAVCKADTDLIAPPIPRCGPGARRIFPLCFAG